MFEILTEFVDEVIVWGAAFGSGFWVHKQVAIDYKERWKSAINSLKDEQLNTKELEEATPKPKPKPSNVFEPAGNSAEFRNIDVHERIRMERERLTNGLPPKDSMRGTSLYPNIATERVAQGWDWNEEDKGWYWRMTATHRKRKAAEDQALKESYSKGYKDGVHSIPMSDHGYKRKNDMYRRVLREAKGSGIIPQYDLSKFDDKW
jgi:hypothetical protein